MSDIVNGRLFIADLAGLTSDDDPAGAVGFTELGLVYDGVERSLLDVLGSARADARLGVDGNGELYVLTKADGEIFRLTALPVATVPTPSTLSVLAVGLAAIMMLRARRA